ncbi:glycogen/starch synthase [Shigella flexneri]
MATGLTHSSSLMWCMRTNWHAGLAPAYLGGARAYCEVGVSVHNLAYQGMFYAHHMNDIQLPW